MQVYFMFERINIRRRVQKRCEKPWPLQEVRYSDELNMFSDSNKVKSWYDSLQQKQKHRSTSRNPLLAGYRHMIALRESQRQEVHHRDQLSSVNARFVAVIVVSLRVWLALLERRQGVIIIVAAAMKVTRAFGETT